MSVVALQSKRRFGLGRQDCDISRYGTTSAPCLGMKPFISKLTLGNLLVGGPALYAQTAGQDMKFFFSSRRRHTRWTGDWSSDVCSSDLIPGNRAARMSQRVGDPD